MNQHASITLNRFGHATLVLSCVVLSATLFLLTFLAWEGWGAAQAPSRAWWTAWTCRDVPERCETRCPYANRPCIVDTTFTRTKGVFHLVWDKGPDAGAAWKESP